MSFVPDTNPGPRVLPKVFADVPSANELAEAKTEAAAARSSRNLLLLVVVLLLGMLITVGGFAFYLQTQAVEIEKTATERVEEAETALEETQAELADVQEDFDSYKAEATALFEQYELISKRRNRNEERREEIEKVFEDNKNARNIRLLRNRTYADTLESPEWNKLRVQVEEELLQEQKRLEEILEAAKAAPRGGTGFRIK